MTLRRRIRTEKAPGAIGIYSQAIVGGGLVHCSGQIALDAESGKMVGEDVRAQTRKVLDNLLAVLEAAGTEVDRVLKCNVYLKDLEDFAAMNEVYETVFSGEEPPARACVQVARLPMDALVEIDCVALV